MAFRIKWKEGEAAHMHEANPKGPNWVNSKFECSDYDTNASKVVVSNEIKLGLPWIQWLDMQRMFMAVMVGVCTGLVAGFIQLCSEKGLHAKFHLLVHLVTVHYNDGLFYLVLALLWVFMIIPAMFGTALVVYIEPKAAGGGLAPVIAYVNGVKVPGALTSKTLVVKTFSLISCMLASLAAGMEAPMAHVGACVASSLVNLRIPFTKMYPLQDLHNDVDRRNFVECGIAAGIVGAFSTPIGGCLMALEEGKTFYAVNDVFRIMIASVSCAVVVNTFMSLFSDKPGHLTERHLLFFFVLRESSILKFYGEELIFYIIIGVLGGLSGTAFNKIQIELIKLRKKYVNKKWKQMVEMGVLVTLTWAFYVTLVQATAGYCSPDLPITVSETYDQLNSIQMGCKSHEEMNTASALTFQSLPNVIRLMYQEAFEPQSVVPLLGYVVVFHLLCVLTMGSMIASGIFIPHLVVGSVWGRCFGQLLRYYSGWEWIQPNKFAFLASGAQLTASVRVPFTVGVLMMESAATSKAGFAVFLSILVSYTVANLFTESIYHHQCMMGGMALVSTDPPPFCSSMKASDLMTPPVTLTKKTTVGTVRDTLKTKTHNCFPIASPTGSLEGSITRPQLIAIISNSFFEGTEINDEQAAGVLTRAYPSKMDVKAIEDVPGETVLDLDRFMEPTPYVVSLQTSFDHVYRLISCLGLRHIIVVDADYKVVGMITRRTLSAYRLHVSAVHASVVKLPIR